MFCGKCGANLKPGEKFCGACGTPVELASPSLPGYKDENHVRPANDIGISFGNILKSTSTSITIMGLTLNIEFILKASCIVLLILMFLPWVGIDAVSMYGVQVMEADSVNGWTIAFGTDDFDGMMVVLFLVLIPIILFLSLQFKNMISFLKGTSHLVSTGLLTVGLICLIVLASSINDDYNGMANLLPGYILTVIIYIIIEVVSVIGFLNSNKIK